MHRHENLARFDRKSHDGTSFQATLARDEPNDLALRNAKLRGVLRIQLHIKVGGIKLAEHVGPGSSSLGMPLSAGGSAREQEHWKFGCGLLWQRTRSLKQESGAAIGMEKLYILKEPSLLGRFRIFAGPRLFTSATI